MQAASNANSKKALFFCLIHSISSQEKEFIASLSRITKLNEFMHEKASTG